MKERILNDLLGYVYQNELIYSNLQWVLHYFEKFEHERNWKTLQLARASLAIAKSDTAKHSLPALETTTEDQENLMKRGIDVNFLSDLGLHFTANKTSLINTFNNLNNGIMYEVFLEDDWKICMRHMANLKKMAACYIRYSANMTDWVLTSINDPATTKKFNCLLEKYCPQTYQRKNPGTLEDIEASANEILDQIEILVMKETKILGAKRERLNFMKYAIEKGKLELTVMKIFDIPPVIFSPKWFDVKDIYYFWEQETPNPRTELERVPDGCLIIINDIGFDMVKAYQKDLEISGLSCVVSKEEDGNFTALYEIRGSEFAIVWENGKVMIFMTKNPICFVPVGVYYNLKKEA